MEHSKKKTTGRGLAELKRAARDRAREALHAMSPAQVLKAGAAIQASAIALPEFKAAAWVGTYLSKREEAPTGDLVAWCRKMGKRVFVPAFHAGHGWYEWAELTEDGGLKKGKSGIEEPAQPRWMEARDLEFVAVPGLAFDRRGGRLGRGGGHFDRLLKECAGFKAGLAFECQLLDRVPTARHDVPMNAVVTESNIYLRRRDAAAELEQPKPGRRP